MQQAQEETSIEKEVAKETGKVINYTKFEIDQIFITMIEN